ncbi:MAG: hypothetical protein CME62_02540 [Halobacteriovoraceae bacterium]|nr:hypothetical protein [Halobacteriovoraceae bacterium]|tara:strand:- start:3928 stop:4302 length:375 start_codon:yes stop_codon:yes gene_type:complete
MTLLLVLTSFQLFAEDHVIYAIDQDIPMGYENEIIKKNFYVNMGSNQGLKEGTVLEVHRTVSNLNPYNNKSRINYSVKIGEIEVLHVQENAAITQLKDLAVGKNTPLFEINNLMIGDKVSVNVN